MPHIYTSYIHAFRQLATWNIQYSTGKRTYHCISAMLPPYAIPFSYLPSSPVPPWPSSESSATILTGYLCIYAYINTSLPFFRHVFSYTNMFTPPGYRVYMYGSKMLLNCSWFSLWTTKCLHNNCVCPFGRCAVRSCHVLSVSPVGTYSLQHTLNPMHSASLLPDQSNSPCTVRIH